MYIPQRHLLKRTSSAQSREIMRTMVRVSLRLADEL